MGGYAAKVAFKGPNGKLLYRRRSARAVFGSSELPDVSDLVAWSTDGSLAAFEEISRGGGRRMILANLHAEECFTLPLTSPGAEIVGRLLHARFEQEAWSAVAAQGYQPESNPQHESLTQILRQAS